MTEYEYEEYYFGSAVWPSEAIWRVDKKSGKRELFVTLGVGRDNLDQLREVWTEITDMTSDAADPTWWSWKNNAGRVLYSMGYWWRYDTSEKEKKVLEEHRKIDPHFKVTEEYDAGKPLY